MGAIALPPSHPPFLNIAVRRRALEAAKKTLVFARRWLAPQFPPMLISGGDGGGGHRVRWASVFFAATGKGVSTESVIFAYFRDMVF